MTKDQFELGAQRLYYVAWALFSGFYVIAGGTQLFSSSGLSIPSWEFLGMVGILLGIVIAPGIAMVVFRWIYRGFVPK